jgi:hypothetical protein
MRTHLAVATRQKPVADKRFRSLAMAVDGPRLKNNLYRDRPTSTDGDPPEDQKYTVNIDVLLRFFL